MTRNKAKWKAHYIVLTKPKKGELATKASYGISDELYASLHARIGNRAEMTDDIIRTIESICDMPYEYGSDELAFDIHHFERVHFESKTFEETHFEPHACAVDPFLNKTALTDEDDLPF